MRENSMRNRTKRIGAAVLAILMVLNLIPASALSTVAAETEHPRAVAITTEEMDYKDSLDSTEIEGITVIPTRTKYSENMSGQAAEYEAVTVSGIEAGDKVAYTMNQVEYENTVPKISKVGTYSVTVKVEREGCKDYIATVSAEIEKGDIDVSVTPWSGSYREGIASDAVSVSGIKAGDAVTYTLNNGAERSTVPKIENAGKYDVVVKIHRNDNYNDFFGEYTAEIQAIRIEGLSAKLYGGTYDGREHEAVLEVDGTKSGDIVEYQLNHGVWSKEMPKVKDAGEYTVSIRVNRNTNYNETEIINLSPSTVVIKKAGQSIQFNSYKEQEEFSFDEEDMEKNVYDFSAIGGELDEPDITYSVENDSEEDKTDIDEIAEIDEKGKLTIKKAGFNIKVIAQVAGDSNYEQAIAECQITIPNNEKDLITFGNKTLSYIVGTNEVVSNQRAIKSYADDNGTITYSAEIDETDLSSQDFGIRINKDTGSLSADYEKLSKILVEHEEQLTIQVIANKTAGTKRKQFGEETEVYAPCEAVYTVQIYFEQAPAETYELKNTEGITLSGPNGTNGWFNTAVTVVPAAEGYLIAKESAANFSDSVEFNNQGTAVREIYLQNTATGGITAPIRVDVEKIDSVKPDSNRISVEYSEPVLSKIFAFYDAPVTILFTAYDDTSGVDHFSWQYSRAEDASTSNLESDYGTVTAVEDPYESGKYTGTITLPKSEVQQLRGYLTVKAIDQAGLESDEKKEDGKIIIVDTISPTEAVAYQLKDSSGTTQTIENHHYFSGDVEFTFTITEANFFAEDIAIKVSKNQEAAEEAVVSWNKTRNQDKYEAKILLSGDGDYVVSMEYKDRMAHQNGTYREDTVLAYTSDVVTIDTISPVIEFSYSNGNNTSAALDNPQTVTLKITEHNFRSGDLDTIVTAQNRNGADLIVNDLQEILRNAAWNQDGDVYTTVLSSELVDAIYNLTFRYKDLALNPAEEVVTGAFIVDHTAPETSRMNVQYSIPWTEKVLEAITFGYYKPNATVTFEAVDAISGIDYFTWSYTKEEGASEINVDSYADTQVFAEQDGSDPSKFAASVTLPKEEAEQLRGKITFNAVDHYSNTSDKITDTNHIIVVDTIAPTMTAEYSAASKTVGNKMYYNKNMTVAFMITEANFYAEDVVIEVSKNGQEYTTITPEWKNTSEDVYVGTYRIMARKNHSNDGDYVFRVSYMDRSTNQMETYTSNTITIDTIRPVIKVEYSNTSAVNTLEDSENHEREYFDSPQTATITITEHNFKASQVDFHIIAKDVTGKELDADSLHTKTSWRKSGDEHIVKITYQGDANYSFDVAYTDLAMNAAKDYAEDYFTVDKTEPENLEVTYSESILDTVLQAISFGFYNAQTSVTITANDSTAGVQGFEYHYTVAAGVSPVNAERMEQMVSEAEITYSDNRQTATAQFNIPSGALGAGSQFNGNISFTAEDCSENSSAQFEDDKRIVVDSISPTSDVTYNAPVQVSGGVSYYDEPIEARVSIDEANFYEEDVEISVTRDGIPYAVTPDWSNQSTDIHIGTFQLSDDGDYIVMIEYTDKSNNTMETYTSEQLTIDTEIAKPIITVNGEEADGRAFKDEVIPAVRFEDTNFESYTVKLSRTRYNDKEVDVTDLFIGNQIELYEGGGSGSFDSFVKEEETDGIYTMTVSITDKAGHSEETSAAFTVNRFGSVYEYDDYLVSLIKDGGAYVKGIQENLVITEYNADRLLSDSLNIEISRDGKPLSEVDYEITPQINGEVSVGGSGWYQYEYTIAKENFSTDGIYKIAISSKDATGNEPETVNYKDKNILFKVDSTEPEIDSITGLEEAIINAQIIHAKYSVYDTIGLASVKVYVDGEIVEDTTDFSEDFNMYNNSFAIVEKNSSQSVRLVVEDLAGNITDTDSEEFESAYIFHKVVTVSTNFFVRFLANRTLLWGTAAGIVLTAAVILLLFGKKKRKNL